MTATNPRDRVTVLRLLRQHLPSGFPVDLGPLTISGVACSIHNGWQSGRLAILHTDKAVNDRLIGNQTPLPVDLRDESIRGFLSNAGGSEDTSAILPYWQLFQEVALDLIQMRGSR